jgi:small subunit ribosomal protein S9
VAEQAPIPEETAPEETAPQDIVQDDPIEETPVPEAPVEEARPEPVRLEKAQYLGTGKRKTSVARVILRPGDGATWFNGRTIESYFPRLTHRAAALAPLKVAGLEGTYDIRVRVHGGGPTGQAGAVRHGIARALVEADPNLRIPLKREGFLTRDARQVERKKAGLHKARKAPQFSKR